jgi:hypothetical protein
VICDETFDRCLDCFSSEDCDDGDDCTADACRRGVCGHEPIAGCPGSDPSSHDVPAEAPSASTGEEAAGDDGMVRLCGATDVAVLTFLFFGLSLSARRPWARVTGRGFSDSRRAKAGRVDCRTGRRDTD